MRNKQIHKGSFMKMLVLSLAVLMLTTLSVPMMASAEVTTGAWADDFDRYTEDVDLSSTGYPGGSAASDVFAEPAAGGGTIIDADGGKDGTPALVITSNTTSANILTWKEAAGINSMEDGQTAVVSYDIKFSGLSNLSNYLSLSGNVHSRSFARVISSGNFSFYNDVNGSTPTPVAITEDAWYTVVHSVSHVGSNEVREVNVYDATGTLVVGKSYTNTWNTSYAGPIRLNLPKTTASTTSLTVDNVKLMIYTEGQAPTLSSMNIEDGAAGVVRNSSFTFEFDRPVTGAPVLKKNGTEPVTTVSAVDMNVVTMTLPTGVLLEKGTPYTIDFSGVTSTDETPLACTELPISFTTEYASLLNDFEVTASAGSGTVTANFTLNHPNGYPNFEGHIAAALYDSEGVLKAIDVLASETVSTGVSLNKTFTLTAASGDGLQVMLFDVTRGVSPVASGECAVTVTP